MNAIKAFVSKVDTTYDYRINLDEMKAFIKKKKLHDITDKIA